MGEQLEGFGSSCDVCGATMEKTGQVRDVQVPHTYGTGSDRMRQVEIRCPSARCRNHRPRFVEVGSTPDGQSQ